MCLFVAANFGLVNKSYFSVVENNRHLVKQNQDPNRSTAVDLLKCITIYGGQVAHIVVCVDTPHFNNRLPRTGSFKPLAFNPLFQYLADEGDFTQLGFLSGFAAYVVISSAIKRGNSVRDVILNKWLRYAFLVVAIISVELCWPLVFSGPNVTLIGLQLSERLTNYWWSSILMVGNYVQYLPGNTIVNMPLAFLHYSYTEFQLFFIGIAAVYLLLRKVELGVSFCAMVIALANLTLYQMSLAKRIIPHTVSTPQSIGQMSAYFTYVHSAPYTFVTPYLVAILCAYFMNERGVTIPRTSKMMASRISWLGRFIAHTGIIFYHHFKVVPLSWTPMYIVCHKLLVTQKSAVDFMSNQYTKPTKLVGCFIQAYHMTNLYLEREMIVDTSFHQTDPIHTPAVTVCLEDHVTNITVIDQEMCSDHTAFLEHIIPFEDTFFKLDLYSTAAGEMMSLNGTEILASFSERYVRTYKSACNACFHIKYNQYMNYTNLTNFDIALSSTIKYLIGIYIYPNHSKEITYVVLSAENQLMPSLESKAYPVASSKGMYSYSRKKITLLPPPFATGCYDYTGHNLFSVRQCATRCMNLTTLDVVIELDGDEDEPDYETLGMDEAEQLAYCKEKCSRPTCVTEDYKMVEMWKEQSNETMVYISFPLSADFIVLYKEKLTFTEFTGLIGTVFGLWLGLSVLSLFHIVEKTLRNLIRHERKKT
ncbi:hypothetical protein HDE_06456 [Halotydeus destructor]|nr:hypothetical protein HDE_06456 [Halotydeus destructor]